MEWIKIRIVKILFHEAENCYAGLTYSKKYLTKEDIDIKDLELWSNVRLE